MWSPHIWLTQQHPEVPPQGHSMGGNSSSLLYKGISAQQSTAWVPTLQHPNAGQGTQHQASALGCSGQGRDLLRDGGWLGKRLRLLVRICGSKGGSGRRNEQASEKSLFCSKTLCKPQLKPKCCPQRGWHWVLPLDTRACGCATRRGAVPGEKPPGAHPDVPACARGPPVPCSGRVAAAQCATGKWGILWGCAGCERCVLSRRDGVHPRPQPCPADPTRGVGSCPGPCRGDTHGRGAWGAQRGWPSRRHPKRRRCCSRTIWQCIGMTAVRKPGRAMVTPTPHGSQQFRGADPAAVAQGRGGLWLRGPPRWAQPPKPCWCSL